jgi:hypothetical protein
MSARALRDILCRAAVASGMAGPREDEGLAEWADGCLDSAVGLRGGPAWQRAHDYVIEALDGAIAGNETIARVAMTAARAIVQSEGRRACACPNTGATCNDAVGRRVCVKCLGRQND